MGAALAGLAGALMAPLITLNPEVGPTFLARSFLVVIIGGIGSVLAAIGGAVVVGLGEGIISAQIGPSTPRYAVRRGDRGACASDRRGCSAGDVTGRDRARRPALGERHGCTPERSAGSRTSLAGGHRRDDGPVGASVAAYPSSRSFHASSCSARRRSGWICCGAAPGCCRSGTPRCSVSAATPAASCSPERRGSADDASRWVAGVAVPATVGFVVGPRAVQGAHQGRVLRNRHAVFALLFEQLAGTWAGITGGFNGLVVPGGLTFGPLSLQTPTRCTAVLPRRRLTYVRVRWFAASPSVVAIEASAHERRSGGVARLRRAVLQAITLGVAGALAGLARRASTPRSRASSIRTSSASWHRRASSCGSRSAVEVR